MEKDPCNICRSVAAKYTCPRCNLQYCSTSCYQGKLHSECSETFYRSCIEEELKSQGPDLKTEDRKVLEALKRLHEQEEEDEFEDLDSDDEAEEVEDLADRVAQVDLDDPDQLWKILTDEEKAEFKRLLASGEAAHSVPQWKPWWDYRSKSKILENEADLEELLQKNGCPKVSSIKSLREITGKVPSPLVQYNLFNLLFAYSYTCLLYNGEFGDFPEEAVANLLKISRNMSNSINFSSADEATEDAVQQVLVHPELRTSTEVIRAARDGVKKIICGPHVLCANRYILAALSDLKNLAESIVNRKAAAEKPNLLKQELRVSEKSEPVDKKKVKLLVKKLEYFLAWTSEFGNDLAQSFSGSMSSLS